MVAFEHRWRRQERSFFIPPKQVELGDLGPDQDCLFKVSTVSTY